MKSQKRAARLKKLTVKAINQTATELCAQVGAAADDIVEAVLAGNTAMHHLLLGLPTGQLALSPFVPAICQAIDIKAKSLGLKLAPGAYLHILPNIAGFVGGDHTATLLATWDVVSSGKVLVVDIGTNTEVSLLENGKITTTSCASGPAFEGWNIKDGMPAAPGAIERLRIANDSIIYRTIADAPAAGLCGSGILDAVAQLYLAEILDKGGRMIQGHHRIRSKNNAPAFVLVSEKERDGQQAIVITQQDVRELQLAKAAIRTGIQILLETCGHTEEELDKVFIAGAFGSYIDIAGAVAIGMFPPLPLDRFQQIGNAAGTGARLALISKGKRRYAQKIASKACYIELANAPNFKQTFIQASYLGLYRLGSRKGEDID